MMKLVNTSRAVIERMPYVIGPNDWLISVYSTGCKPPKTPQFKNKLVLKFDDVWEPWGRMKPITVAQAMRIAKFVIEAENSECVTLWTHCDAGICRSGAIVEAIATRGHKIDNSISNERVPNHVVYELLMKAFIEIS